MGDPVQDPGYIRGQPSNYSENNQLSELEKSENRAYAPQATSDPTPYPVPDPISDATPEPSSEPEIPRDSNIFNAVSEAYQAQIKQGNLAPNPESDSSSSASSAVTDDDSGGSSDSDSGNAGSGGSDDASGGGGSAWRAVARTAIARTARGVAMSVRSAVAVSVIIASAWTAPAVAQDDCDVAWCPPPSCSWPVCDSSSGTNPGGSAGSSSSQPTHHPDYSKQGDPGGSGPTQTEAQRKAGILSSVDLMVNVGATYLLTQTTTQPAAGQKNWTPVINALTQKLEYLLPSSANLPSVQGESTPQIGTRLPDTEPVAGDGEFVIDETDLDLPGIGLPFRFSRHYRSGIDEQSPLGFGWNHTFNQRLVIAPPVNVSNTALVTQQPDVILINDRLERIRFAFVSTSPDGIDLYRSDGRGTDNLTHPHSTTTAAWRIAGPDGIFYDFDSTHLTLESISDAAGHRLRVGWNYTLPAGPNNAKPIWSDFKPQVVTVTDTTGRVIHFNYRTIDSIAAGLPAFTPSGFPEDGAHDNAFSYLACLSLDETCQHPLVSFDVSAVAAVSTGTPQTIGEYSQAQPVQNTPYTYEFDLVHVANHNGFGPTYKYYELPGKNWYWKEFDSYWPSKHAAEYQNYFSNDAILTASCTQLVNAVMLSWWLQCTNVDCQGWLTSSSEHAKQNKACKKLMSDGLHAMVSSTYKYGTPPQVVHNVTEVDDAEGRVAVQNVYGTDPSQPSFDRVSEQILDGDTLSPTKYVYLDLTRHDAFGFLDGLSPASPLPFRSVNLCPQAPGGYGPAETEGAYLTGIQSPTLEVIRYGPLNRNVVTYVDAAGRSLRETDAVGLTTDLNYAGPNTIAQRAASGRRTCVAYDPNGLPLHMSQLPAPAAKGEIITTDVTYDKAAQIVSVARTAGGALVEDQRLVRDSWERVIEVDAATDAAHWLWTCLTYTDTPVSRLPVSIHAAASATPKPEALPVAMIVPRMPAKRCSANEDTGALYNRAALPSRITRADGSVTLLNGISAGGPAEMVIDANGPSPLGYYWLYDDNGHVREEGLENVATHTPVPESRRSWTFDLEGRVQSQAVENQNAPGYWVTTTFSYDKAGHVLSAIDPKLSQTYSVNVFGKILSQTATPVGGVTQGAPRSTCFTYDAYGDLIQQISAEGDVTSVSRDGDGRPTQVSQGPLLTNVYLSGANGHTCLPKLASLRDTNAREVVEAVTYDAGGRVATITQNGVTRNLSYDGQDRLVDVFIADHLAASTQFRGLGPVAVPVGAHLGSGWLGHRVLWQAVSDSNLNGALPTYLTPGLHAMTEEADDWLGRPIQTRLWQFVDTPIPTAETPNFATTTRSYDDEHNSITIVDPRGLTTKIRFDGADRPVESDMAPGTTDAVTTTMAYADNGLATTTIRTPAPTSSGSWTAASRFSPQGVLLQGSEQGKSVIDQAVDGFGRVSLLRTNDMLSLRPQYDAFDDVISQSIATDPHLPAVTATFSYDRESRLRTVTDGAGHSSSYSYDLLGRLAQKIDGLGETDVSYVVGSQRPARITAPAALFTSSYNLAGRLTQLVIAAGPERVATQHRSFAYSATGTVTEADVASAGPGSAIKLTYDSLGRRVSETDSTTNLTLSHIYGANDEQIQIGTLGSLHRYFDVFGRPLRLEAIGKLLASLVYSQGEMAAVHYADGALLKVSFDDRLRVINEAVTRGGSAIGVARINRVFGPDDTPHLQTLSIGGLSVESRLFATDTAGRLVGEGVRTPGLPGSPGSFTNAQAKTAWGPSGRTYTLDGAANWSSVSGARSLATQVDTANRYVSLNGSAVTNVQGGGPESGAAGTYTWDGLDHLVSAGSSGTPWGWSYDAFDRSATETGPGGSTTLIWDGTSLIGTVNGGQLTLRAGFDGPSALAVIASPGSANPTFALHHGPDGSVFAVTKPSGELIQAYSYSAYGEPTTWADNGKPSTAAPISPDLFQAARYNTALGLSLMGARAYSPSIGRFLSPDPVGQAGGLNLFAFVADRPLLATDPNGTHGRPEATAASRGNGHAEYHSWVSTLTSDYYADALKNAVNQTLGSNQGIANRVVGAMNWAVTLPIALAEKVTNLPGAFVGNIIDQNTLRDQGRYFEADQVSDAAGQRLQEGLLGATIAYGGHALLTSEATSITTEQSLQTFASGALSDSGAAAPKGPYTIYFVYGEGGSESLSYVGITRNFSTRLVAQFENAGREINPIFDDIDSLDLARGVEQNLIELYGGPGRFGVGGILTNKINSISPSAANYPALMQMGRVFLHSKGWPGF